MQCYSFNSSGPWSIAEYHHSEPAGITLVPGSFFCIVATPSDGPGGRPYDGTAAWPVASTVRKSNVSHIYHAQSRNLRCLALARGTDTLSCQQLSLCLAWKYRKLEASDMSSWAKLTPDSLVCALICSGIGKRSIHSVIRCISHTGWIMYWRLTI